MVCYFGYIKLCSVQKSGFGNTNTLKVIEIKVEKGFWIYKTEPKQK